MGYILALKLYVVDEAYIEYLWKFEHIDFSKLHGTYKDWILNQYRELKKERATLRETAEKLYAVYMKPVDELTPHEQAVKEMYGI